MSPRQYIHCADNIGVFFIATIDTGKLRLAQAVLFGDMPAARASSARVVRRHGHQRPAIPAEFVRQLAAKLEPALVENGFVQTPLARTFLPGFSVPPAADLYTGFETPTLAESAYRPGGAPGPNFALKPSKSTQGEIGVKLRSGAHSFDAALFEAKSKDEIVSSLSSGGRAVFQNADKTTRRGLEASWLAHWAGGLDTRLAYTLLDARFDSAYAGAQGPVPADNRLPGAPRHSLFADVQASLTESVKAGLETRLESKTYVNDLNGDAAPGYAVFNASLSREFRFNGAKLLLYGRIDHLLDKTYAGSLIVNDNNGRYFEAAPGRRLFVGVRSVF